MDNQTTVSEFLLLEFSKVRELQILHFVGFLVLYLAIVTANVLIISAIVHDRHLHTPMYFFLMNLALQDLGAVTVIIPKSMANSLMNTRQISFSGCVAQILLFMFFVSSNFFLLMVMAYDRYVAICNPLQYEMLMNWRACSQMVASVWVIGLLYAALHTCGTFATPFCSNVVNQFFCEIPQLLKLACSGFYLIEITFEQFGVTVLVCCFFYIVVSYVKILTAVLRIPSVQGRKKAFSTCLPHLLVVCTYSFTVLFAYLKSPSSSASHLDLAFTVIYSMVPPMMNPVIYSLRNKDIKAALSKLFA